MTKHLSLVKRHLKMAYDIVPQDDKHTRELKEVIRLTIGFVEAMEPSGPIEEGVVVDFSAYVGKAAGE